jgi:ribonuclease-3
MSNVDDLQAALGVAFKDRSLAEMALVHSSYINENPDIFPGDNERLEFFGDAILGYLVAEKLYQDCPELNEGEMTRIRSALVSRQTLARIAGTIDLGACLYIGKGEETSGGRKKVANLAGAMEAVIAAVCLDQGISATRDMVLRLVGEDFAGMLDQGPDADYKSKLQQLAQSRWHVAPEYRLVVASGPDHAKVFEVEVIVNDKVVGTGIGKSKKLAETEAARRALEKL